MTDQPTDLDALLVERGIVDQEQLKLASLAGQQVQQIRRSALSMTADNADDLVEYTGAVLNRAKEKGNADEIAVFSQGLAAARACARYRRRLERLRSSGKAGDDATLPDGLEAYLHLQGVMDPTPAQVAAVCSGMVQQIMKTAYSLSVEDTDRLVRYARALLMEVRRTNHPRIPNLAHGLAHAEEFAKYRRRLERLRG